MAHAVGRDGQHALRLGQCQQRLVCGLLTAPAVALDVDRHLAGAERVLQQRQPIGRRRMTQRLGPGQRDQTGHAPRQLRQPHPPLALGHTGLHVGQQPAQVLVARTALHQHR